MSDTTTDILYSFVAPVYNEAEGLEHFYDRLKAVAEGLGEPYEILFVNDGSTDDSLEVLRHLAARDGRVKYIDFSRNFGHQLAVTAGYDFATGRAVISLDSDCQHPPEVIPQLIERWQGGAEVVCTVRSDTDGISRFRRGLGRWVYRAIHRLSGLDVADQADFRLLDRKVVLALRGLREQARFVRGLVRWVGFRQATVPYQAEKRHAGQSHYSLRQLAAMGLAGAMNFSLMPLRTVGGVGLALWAAGGLYALIAGLGAWLWGWGFSGLALLGLALTGLQLVCLAAVGEYVGRIYEEAKGRPLYVVRHAHGFEADETLEPEAPAQPPSASYSRFSVMT